MVWEMIEEMLAKYVFVIFKLSEGRAVFCMLAIFKKIQKKFSKKELFMMRDLKHKKKKNIQNFEKK